MFRHLALFIGMTFAAASIAQAQIGPSSTTPRVLSAYFGYNDCVGIIDANNDGDLVDEALAAGCNVKLVPGTSTQVTNVATPQQLAPLCTGDTVPTTDLVAVDGMPVTFSGPVVPFGLSNKSFVVTLSDGTHVTPRCVTLVPANEFNELETVLIMGTFGGPRSQGGTYPVSVTVTGGIYVATAGKPVREVPPGTTIAVTDYDSGPFLLGAAIAPFTGRGEIAIANGQYPNHCQVAFPSTTHVIQLLWSGGVTLDGVNSILPTQAGLLRTATTDGLFNLKVRSRGGVLLDYYDVPAVRVLGAADLGNGQPTDPTAAYNADGDNYIDLCVQLPGGFDASRIEQIVTDPNNSFGLQLFDPSGDTPNAPETFAIQDTSGRR